MDVERTIDEIEQLQEMFEAPDIRPLSASDISAANRRHDAKLAHSPWFRLWHQFWRLLPIQLSGNPTRGNRVLGFLMNADSAVFRCKPSRYRPKRHSRGLNELFFWGESGE
jgi:hypothetical protein